ncbi:MAG: FAD binding domain-containing protein [Acetobacteraceae bacterium]
MKPVDFDYARPETLGAAIDLLAVGNGDAKAVAGAQSLGPMLNLRLVQPELLVDVTAIPDLTGTREEAGALVIGAAVTHAELEDNRSRDRTRAVLAGIAFGIAYRAVRNRGTIGGSLAHADPAADWLVCATALGARLVLRGLKGRRVVSVAEFVTGAFETVLAPDEVIVEVEVPLLSAGARWGYYKVCRKRGEFAEASAAVLVDDARGTRRSVIGATSGRPLVIEDPRPLAEIAGDAVVAEAVVADALAPTALGPDPLAIRMHGAALARAIAGASS